MRIFYWIYFANNGTHKHWKFKEVAQNPIWWKYWRADCGRSKADERRRPGKDMSSICQATMSCQMRRFSWAHLHLPNQCRSCPSWDVLCLSRLYSVWTCRIYFAGKSPSVYAQSSEVDGKCLAGWTFRLPHREIHHPSLRHRCSRWNTYWISPVRSAGCSESRACSLVPI